MLDCLAGYNEEMVVKPDEALIAEWGDFDWYFHDQTTILAVPDSNVIETGCCDLLARGGEYRRVCKLVLQCLCLFAIGDLPNCGCVETPHGDEFRRVWRETDRVVGVSRL